MAVKDDLARLTREDYEYRKKLLEPYEAELRDLASDTSIVGNAREDAGQIAERGTAQTSRMLSRYGAQQTGAAARMSQLGANLAEARTGTNMINNAQDQQDTLRFNVLGQGVAAGRRRLNNALGMMGDSANMASSRQAAFNSANQQYRANQWSTGAALAGAAAFFI